MALFAISGIAQEEDPANKAKEYLNAGIKASQTGDHQAAIVNYRAAIDNDPDLVDAYLNLGASLFATKSFDEALEQFQKAAEKDSKNADAFANIGRVNYTMRRYPDAITALNKAIELSPGDADLYKDLGKSFYKSKAYPEVVNSLQKCHEQGGGDYTTYLMLGRALEKGDKTTEAIAALKKSNELKNNYSAHFALGQIYMQQEKYKSASSSFRRAMNADKGKFRAAYNYASAAEYSDPENYSANLKNWEEFVRIARNNAKAQTQVSQAQAHIKELKEAIEQAELQ
jgi:superkiller protein 3